MGHRLLRRVRRSDADAFVHLTDYTSFNSKPPRHRRRGGVVLLQTLVVSFFFKGVEPAFADFLETFRRNLKGHILRDPDKGKGDRRRCFGHVSDNLLRGVFVK